SGCRCAPRPGAVPAGSGTAAGPRSPAPTTTRNSAALVVRWRHPTQVRTGRTGSGSARGRSSGRATSHHSTRSGPVHRTGLGPDALVRRRPSPVAGRLVRADVDTPAGEPGGEPGVLALLADRQRELVVGNDHPGGAGGGVDHLHRGDPGRAQRVAHELRGVLGPVDDVDLL